MLVLNMKALWFLIVILTFVYGPEAVNGETQADNKNPSLLSEDPRNTSTKLSLDNLSSDCTNNFLCPGDGLFGDPCDCTKYHQCHAGHDYENTCPPGTLWSHQFQHCDLESNVDCSTVGQVKTGNPETKDASHLIIKGPKTTCQGNQTFISVCYYSNWAYYNKGIGKYTVDDIDLNVCTHLVYAFAVLDAKTHKIKAQDSGLDLPSGLNNYNKFTSLKNKKPGLKTTIAIGGSEDSKGSYKYSDLVASSSLRSAFIQHVILFLQKYNFDGLDLDWEFPASSDGGRAQDKANFAKFVRELKTAFAPHGLSLTAAVMASEQIATKGYDIPTLSKYLDYIHLMTYDFHGDWDKKADHHSKLYNDSSNFNADYTVTYWINNGAPPKKLVLGIPIYGRSFTLSSGVTKPPAPSSGKGSAGSIIKTPGLLSYLEICINVKNGWTVVTDKTGQMGPYAYSGKQWVGYDDADMARIKAQYIKTRGLGGSMVWAIDLEDFKNTCGQGSNPLLNAIANTLRNETCRSSPERNRITTSVKSSCNVQFECPEDGLWADPCNCQKFYQCHEGVGYHLTCAAGTLWNQALKTCDFEGNVVCSVTTEE